MRLIESKPREIPHDYFEWTHYEHERHDPGCSNRLKRPDDASKRS